MALFTRDAQRFGKLHESREKLRFGDDPERSAFEGLTRFLVERLRERDARLSQIRAFS